MLEHFWELSIFGSTGCWLGYLSAGQRSNPHSNEDDDAFMFFSGLNDC